LKGLKPILQSGGRVVAAFDADQAGELMAWRLAQQLPGVERLTPKGSKDWNAMLINPQDGENSRLKNQSELFNLWQWHPAARELGRPVKYLHRIVEVAKTVVQGEPLSEKARVAMNRDLDLWARQRKVLAQHQVQQRHSAQVNVGQEL
jgi:DNA primase